MSSTDATRRLSLPEQSSPASRGKVFFGDPLLFFLILVTPYYLFAEKVGILTTASSAIIFIGLAAIALVLAALLVVLPRMEIRIVLVSILLCLFIDVQFSVRDRSIAGARSDDVLLGSNMVLFLAAAGALMATSLVRRNHKQILTAIFATFLVSSIALSVPKYLSSPATAAVTQATPVGRSPHSVHLHIILDEMIGIAGLSDPDANHDRLRDDVVDFLVRNGFRVLSRAYSQTNETSQSIPATLNFRTRALANGLMRGSSSTDGEHGAQYSLTHNAYFDRLLADGYRLRVYQSAWIDFCTAYGNRLAACHTYGFPFNAETLSRFTFAERLQIVASIYAMRHQSVRLVDQVVRGLRAAFYGQPAGGLLWDGWIGPPVVFPTVERLTADLSKAKLGDAFFAHLLLPHHPYTVDSGCDVKRPIISSWSEQTSRFELNSQHSTEQGRRERYIEYAAQVRCALRKLDGMFDVLKKRGLFDTARIVVHGDHGSRLQRVIPVASNAEKLSRQDFLDAYSTLFAVRLPDLSAGLDPAPIDVPQLLKQTMSQPSADGSAFVSKTAPEIFLPDTERGGIVRKPLP